MTLPSGRVLSLHGDDTAAPPRGEAAPAHALHDQLAAARRAAAARHMARHAVSFVPNTDLLENKGALSILPRAALARVFPASRAAEADALAARLESGGKGVRVWRYTKLHGQRVVQAIRAPWWRRLRGRAGRPHGEPSRGRGRPRPCWRCASWAREGETRGRAQP